MSIKGPIEGLTKQVLDRLEAISKKLKKDVIVTPEGGKRSGPVDKSAHNSGIAVDAYVEGMLSVEFADHLVEAGLSGVGEYYKSNGNQERFAHGDIRGLEGSEQSGAYSPTGKKSKPLCWYRLGKKYTFGKRKSGHSCSEKTSSGISGEAPVTCDGEDLFYDLTEVRRSAADEAKWWEEQKGKAEAALAFWETFLALRKGANNDKKLEVKDRGQFICAIRAVSWVESKHGHGSGNYPERDPMQAGNPEDTWWKLLLGKFPERDRFVRGPGATPNYYAEELPAVMEKSNDFPTEARLSYLKDKKKGHGDTKFNASTSYYWGIAYLIYCVNKKGVSNGKAYACGDCSTSRMKKGAVEYNGGGNPNYGKLIDEAWKLIGCK